MSEYQALSHESLALRLGDLDVLKQAVGDDSASWSVHEIGDGNLNLVFIVEGPKGSVIVKQALPYVRLVGDSWPLPLKRAFFEYHALTRQDQRAPSSVPNVLHFDEVQALIVMERLQPHIILRLHLMAGQVVHGLGAFMGRFCAQTAFRGSDLSMAAPDKKSDVALFAGNVELCDITENLVFTDPYLDAEMNRHTSPQLDSVVAELRADQLLKIEAQHMKRTFTSKAETMCHGDLHAGSIMSTSSESRVIDPEFAFYGPFGFDIGMLIGNYLMAYHAAGAHLKDKEACGAFQEWILETVAQTWSVFCDEFSSLWRTERTGMLYSRTLYEDQGDEDASE
ncbi:MAG: S-methyl-5-thioribose kinase, partial [Pseudomonadota bacterium]